MSEMHEKVFLSNLSGEILDVPVGESHHFHMMVTCAGAESVSLYVSTGWGAGAGGQGRAAVVTTPTRAPATRQGRRGTLTNICIRPYVQPASM